MKIKLYKNKFSFINKTAQMPKTKPIKKIRGLCRVVSQYDEATFPSDIKLMSNTTNTMASSIETGPLIGLSDNTPNPYIITVD